MSYLYFYKNNYIDKDIYNFNKIQENIMKSKVYNKYIPYNGNKLNNYYKVVDSSKNNKARKYNFNSFLFDSYPNTTPIKSYPQQLLNTKNCARKYQKCFSNDKNIIYYGLNNLK